MKKYFRFFVIFLAFSCWIPHIVSAQVVNIPDANLAMALREGFGLAPNAPITKQHMQVIGGLFINDSQITNLTGLEHATELEALGLGNNQISDIRPLAGLTQLTILGLEFNQIRDVSPLAGLTQLQALWLNHNQISDIRPLAGLTRLQELYLGENQIRDVNPLTRLTQLETLSLYENQIRDVSPLAGLTRLEILSLSANQIRDIRSLSGMTRLTELYLWSNDIRDVSPLTSLMNLTKLLLAENPITDTSPLAKLTKLTSVDVEITAPPPLSDGQDPIPEPVEVDVEITPPPPPPASKDLIPDAGLATVVREALGLAPNAPITEQDMQRLTTLDAGSRQITDLTGLENATQLEALMLSDNRIRDIRPLAGLTQLMVLDLQDNQIKDVSPLAQLMQLEVLNLNNNEIRYVSLLGGLTQLKTLRLAGNNIRNVSAFADLVNLETLELADNPVTDISPLAILTKLTDVDVKIAAPSPDPRPTEPKPDPPQGPDLIPDPRLATAVRKTLGLALNAPITEQAMQKLTVLRAANSQIKDLTGLEHATQLTELYFWKNQITDVSPLAGLVQLEVLSLGQNQISDVSPLAGLTELMELLLGGNQISDVSPLARLVNLRQLILAGNPITNTTPLANLTNLVKVDVKITALPLIPDTNLAAAVREALGLAPNAAITEQAVKRLTTLDADDFEIEDLTGLEHATQLESFSALNHRISDLHPLKNLTNLRTLDLTGVGQISDLHPLENLTNLRDLDLTGSTQISDFTPLAKLPNLTSLGLFDAEIDNRDLTAIAMLTKLTSLGLGFNNISDIRPLAKLTNLTWLSLIDNNISDVTPLAKLTNLTWLAIRNNPITDTSPLASLTQLVKTDIEISTIADAMNTIVSISPSQVPSPAVGEQLTFSLNITNGESVAGYQATITYNISALRYVSSANGDYLSKEAFFVPPVATGNNLILVATSQSGERRGDGTLATLTFEVVAAKASTLSLSDVLLSDGEANGLSPQVEGGQVTEPPKLEGDVNSDGVVNIQDLVLVASNLGKTGQNVADVNGDDVVDIRDLVLVAGALGTAAAAPSLHPQLLETLTAADVQGWLSQTQYVDLTDITSQRGIRFLEQLLATLIPKESALLANYPNPFNPETWIPYQLTKPADVTLTIYAVNGRVVRRLALGHQLAGVYQSRSRAAYWDGRNELGEPVASGLYFYTLIAGDFTATRKMLIRK